MPVSSSGLIGSRVTGFGSGFGGASIGFRSLSKIDRHERHTSSPLKRRNRYGALQLGHVGNRSAAVAMPLS